MRTLALLMISVLQLNDQDVTDFTCWYSTIKAVH